MPKWEFDRVVAVDWSGRIDAAGQRRHIWAGVWTRRGMRLEAGRTREELTAWLIELARETPRMVVGIDCCFSYPAWFLREHGCATVLAFWKHVGAGHGERWLAGAAPDLTAERDARFWGKPHKRPLEFSGEGLWRSMRRTDMDNKITPRLLGGDPERAAKMLGITPKSPFQIGGSGSVGTGSLRAMPFLLQLREAGFRVWPFENADGQRPLLVEIYTRLLTGPVAKSNAAARRAYLAARRKEEPEFYGRLPRGVLAKAHGSEDAFDALVCAMEMARARDEFGGLRATEDAELRLEGVTWRPGVGPRD